MNLFVGSLIVFFAFICPFFGFLVTSGIIG
ncbi:hypothetical protein VP5_007 [Vibrio virus VPMCC5]|nr:hypothetical protein VP5_007 [Vibrio virus VPMCC5]